MIGDEMKVYLDRDEWDKVIDWNDIPLEEDDE